MKYFDFQHITFAHPEFFWLLLLLPILVYYQYVRQKKKHSSLFVTTKHYLDQSGVSFRTRLHALLPVLRILALLLFIVALARPQNSKVNETINNEGLDIVLSLDISGSMLAQDFNPNRMEAAKKVAGDFILNRPTDRIGLVIFSGESFTQCPLTTDQNVLLEQVKNIRSGLLEDGTAIGMGLATAVERLRNSKAKTKIIILMTDGVNNSGLIDPITALEIAKAYKIRVYTIGVGSTGNAPYPVQDQFGNTRMQQMPVQIDEALMQKISTETGGKYFRATSNTSLEKVYQEIDKLEKTKIEINSYKRYAELFFAYAFIGFCLLLLELLIRYTYIKSIHD
ncbi:MAG: VWA domain-containing protein [Bacteroidetes bacterium]|nr:VWA domain-containing protein [Bacteroidota bacterium]MBK8144993.1 VWA domain-containing protein [Bacteroidota bacterium]MBP6314975.1 VWA domain-containing protein [Chitinophagaceae bacterium]